MRQTRCKHRNELGFTLIELMIVIAIIGILIGVAVFGFKNAQKAGYDTATRQNLQTIAAIEIQYYNTHGRTFGTFEQMLQEKVLSTKFEGNPPVVDGYILTLKVIPKSATAPASYTLNADPQSDATGTNHFYLDSAGGELHVNATQPAGPNDPVP